MEPEELTQSEKSALGSFFSVKKYCPTKTPLWMEFGHLKARKDDIFQGC